MAQAEFERNKQQGGFDSTSYRAAEPESGARVLTPLQQKLAGLEKALPAALRSRALAFVLAAAVLAAGVVGIGGAKLKGRQASVQALYTATNEHGSGMTGDLALRADAAANLIRLCGQVLGTDDATVQAAQAALDGWNAAAGAGGPADQFAANTALGGAVTAMYQQTDAAGGVTEAISGQYTEFLSRQDIILRTAANDYNPAAQGYNDTVSGFPANVIGLLWGVGEVQLFQ